MITVSDEISHTFAAKTNYPRTMEYNEKKMRRFVQQLPPEDAKSILATATNGVLSLIGPDGAPYGVPLSYCYDGDKKIYFHCAKSGYKLDCLNSGDGRCSFCVVAQDVVLPAEFTTLYRSVIVTGRLTIVSDIQEILTALRMLATKYSPGIDSANEISRNLDRLLVLCLDISTITGKESIELVRIKQKK